MTLRACDISRSMCISLLLCLLKHFSFWNVFSQCAPLPGFYKLKMKFFLHWCHTFVFQDISVCKSNVKKYLCGNIKYFFVIFSNSKQTFSTLVQFDMFMPFSLEELYLFKCIYIMKSSDSACFQKSHFSRKRTWNLSPQEVLEIQIYSQMCLRNKKKVTETQNAFKDEFVWGVLSVCYEHPRSLGF